MTNPGAAAFRPVVESAPLPRLGRALDASAMVRTQISLTEDEYAAAKPEVRRLGISLAELLRRSLRHMLPADEQRPWMRYAGLIESGDAASSLSRLS